MTSMINFGRSVSKDDDSAIRTRSKSTLGGSTGSNISQLIFDASSKVQLDISDLYYHVATVGKIKVLLKDINLQIKSGEMCAIMGPTGSGKSTLLELLAGRKLIGFYSGEVMLNKKPRPDWFQQISAYVLQEDILLPTLTVGETLRYAACTRMEGTSTLQERDARVKFLLDLFGMSVSIDTIVGEKGAPNALDEAQRKKVAIMVEIIALPKVIFMDEPTSCLSRSVAMDTMTAMRKITDSSRVCLTAIHHPSSELFALFDRLILLSAGRVIYSGPIDKVVTYFESIGFPYVSSQIAGDYIIQICGDKHKSPVEFQALFNASKYSDRTPSVDSTDGNTAANAVSNPILAGMNRRTPSTNMSVGFNELTSLHQPVRASLYRQLGMLFHRGFLHNVRDVASMKDELFKAVLFGFIVGIAFFDNANLSGPLIENSAANGNVEQPTPQVVNFTGIFFFIFTFMWLNNTLSIHSLTEWNALYRRELNSAAFNTLPYWFSSLNIKLPFRLVTFTIFVGIFYPMCSFPSDFSYFILLYVILFLTGIMSFYASQTFVALFGSASIAHAIVPHMFLFFGLFSGYPVLLDDVPPGYIWAKYVSFLRWSFESLMINQFGDNNMRGVNDDVNEQGDAAVIAYYGYGEFQKETTIAILAICMGILSVLTFYGMMKATNTLFHMSSAFASKEAASSRGGSEHSHNTHNTVHKGNAHEISHFDVEASQNHSSSSHSGGHSSGLSSGHRYSEEYSHGSRNSTGFYKGSTSALQNLRLSLSRMSGGTFGAPGDITIEDPDRYFALDLDDFRSSNIGAENVFGVKVDLVGLSYNYISPDGQNIDVLSSITGSINSGTMVAVMGSQDCGKATLLDVMAGRRTNGAMSGMLLFNGMERNDDIGRSTSYVTQADIHLSMLTVRETLTFAAELRMDANETKLNKEVRVNKVIEMMSLKEQSEQLVGATDITTRGLNGGQRRRLSMGVEIINFPALIYLDEPTTGLDALTSDEVIAAVRNLANQNRTAICTIQHPSAKAYGTFDLLILLSKGQVIYWGPIKSAVNFFQNSPFQFKYESFINPAEYVLAISEQCIVDGVKEKLVETDQLVEYFKSRQGDINLPQSSFSSDHVSALTQSDTMMQLGELVMKPYKSSTYNQIKTLFERYKLRTLRTQQPLIISFVRCVLVGFLLGSLFNNSAQGPSFTAYHNRFTFCFFSLFFTVLVQIQTIPIYYEDLAQFNKEKEAKLFLPACYWLSTWCVHSVLIFLHTLLFSILSYSISGYCVTASEFIVYFFVLYFSGCTAFIMAQISAMSCENTPQAIRLFTISMLVNSLFAGYFQYIPNMQGWLSPWVPNINFMRWGYQALVTNELNNDDKLKDTQYYLSLQGFDDQSITESVLIVLAFLFVHLYALSFIVFVRSHKK